MSAIPGLALRRNTGISFSMNLLGCREIRKGDLVLGLGLAIVRRILEAHNGDISVNSALGQGSGFTVRLPLRQGVQNAMVA